MKSSASDRGIHLTYPRIYKPSRSDLISYSLIGGFLVLLGLLGIISPSLLRETRVSAVTMLVVGVPLGIFILTRVAGAELTLRSDSIELKSIYSSRELRKADILGRCEIYTRAGQMLVLIPRGTDEKRFAIPTLFARDSAFDGWLHSIPDLDAKEYAKSKSSLRAMAGATGIASARKTERVFNWITGAVVTGSAVGWVIDLFYPFPLQLLIVPIAVVPVVAIAIAVKSRGLYRMWGADNDARPTLAVPVVVLGIFLALCATRAPQLLNLKLVVLVSIALGLVVAALIVSKDPIPYPRTVPILGLALASAFYFVGLIVEVDVQLDRSLPTSYQAVVEEKDIYRGRRGQTSYSLSVSAWGSEADSNGLDVSEGLFNSVSPGQTVTINLHAGTLKIPWVTVSRGP